MSPPQALAECYFLDVGQGAAQVVLLPDGGALVIDCGPARNVRSLYELLKRSLRGDIEALVITHNDEDHDGGTVDIFAEFGPLIRQVFLYPTVHERKSGCGRSLGMSVQPDVSVAPKPGWRGPRTGISCMRTRGMTFC